MSLLDMSLLDMSLLDMSLLDMSLLDMSLLDMSLLDILTKNSTIFREYNTGYLYIINSILYKLYRLFGLYLSIDIRNPAKRYYISIGLLVNHIL